MTKDLSIYDRPVSDLFVEVNGPDSFRLKPEQIEFFKENGYLSDIEILNDLQIDRLRDELAELMRPEQAENPLFYEHHQNESDDPAKVLFHALGSWRISPAFHDLLFNPAMTVPASQLLGGPVRFWHDQVFVKPAHDGAAVVWHQDYSYWTRTVPVGHLTCWIALDDSTKENGCVHYIPGSHKWNLLPKTPLANEMDSIFEVLNDEQQAHFKPVAIELKKGRASFHHPLMVHGSYNNSTAGYRRAAVVNMVLDGVVSNSDEPLLEGVPVILAGERLSGRFFPILTPEKC